MSVYVVIWNKFDLYKLEKAFFNYEDALNYKKELIDKFPEYYHDYCIEEIELKIKCRI